MAYLTNNASADSAMNGLGATTHVLTMDDVSTNSVDAIRAEAEQEGFTVVGIEASNSGATQDADLILLQGTGTPSITGCTLLGTIQQKTA
jgi:hypothetical protein